jgi:hypothetical protein
MRPIILGLLFWLGAAGFATAAPEGSTAASTPIERQPYRIEVHLFVDPATRIDASKRAGLLEEWRALVDRFVGTPWVLTVRSSGSPLAGRKIGSLTPELFADLGTDHDKFWVIRIGLRSESETGGYLLTGREFDVATQRLGAIQSKTAVVDAELPRALLGFSVELFNPVALISGQEGGRTLLTVRGASLSSASPIGAVAAPGTVFIPLRLTTARDGKPLILRIPYTYLKVESITGSVARCEFVKGISDPLSKRWPRPFTFAAIGIKPGDSPLKLRFVTRKDKVEVPVAGYVLTTREVPDGSPREVGVTDRSGRIEIKSQFARGLVIVRLLAGSAEPLFEVPMMAGESTDERVISVRLLPRAVRLETELDSLRDQIVDLVALRARLQSRMKARLEGEDWDGLDATIKEFQKLSPRDALAERVKTLKEQAARQQVERKVPILTRTAQARVDELQALIDRYLNDDEVNSYTEALASGRAEAAEKAKAPAKRKRDAAGKVIKEPAPTPAPLPPPLPAAAPVVPKAEAEPKAKDAAPKAKSTPNPNVQF